MEDSKATLTTSTGAPVGDNLNSLSVGPRGPTILADLHLVEKLAHFDRERIPERVVHAKGAGAHGTFTVTNDVTSFCKAKVFESVGKKTPVFVRFSTVGGEKGSADTARDPRGFAVKFYTDEGNWDLVGNNTPVFFIRDAIRFPDFIHSQKRCPQTNIANANMFWSFLSHTPESIHQVTILFSDRGTPDGYRHMNGYGSHSFKLVNKDNEVFYVKFHLKTCQGIKNLSAAKAQALAASDPDYATRDLFEAIKAGNFPKWKMFIQVMPERQALTYRHDVTDVTKVWPHSDYPLIPVGELELNRNPENYFAEVEQAAFSPGNLVPGIEPSEDKMLQGRLFSYPDTHRHRLGANFNQLPINRPRCCPLRALHIRDGPMCFSDNYGALPNFDAASYGGFAASDPSKIPVSTTSCLLNQRDPTLPFSDDFEQAGELYRKVMTAEERTALVSNIASHLRKADREASLESLKRKSLKVQWL